MADIPFLDLRAITGEAREALREAADRVIDSGWFILGKEVEAFEADYAAYCGTAHCVGVGNGLDALALTLRAFGIGEGDEVIVPSNTYIATWLAVSQTGAAPVRRARYRHLQYRSRADRGGDHAAHALHPSGPSLRPAGGHGADPKHRPPARPQRSRRPRRMARATRGRGSAAMATPSPGASIRPRISARSATPAR